MPEVSSLKEVLVESPYYAVPLYVGAGSYHSCHVLVSFQKQLPLGIWGVNVCSVSGSCRRGSCSVGAKVDSQSTLPKICTAPVYHRCRPLCWCIRDSFVGNVCYSPRLSIGFLLLAPNRKGENGFSSDRWNLSSVLAYTESRSGVA